MDNLGLHIIGDWFVPAKLRGPRGQAPRVVKLVDPSAQYVRDVRNAVGKDCLIVIRFYEPTQVLTAPDTDARAWYARHVAQMLQMTDPNVAFESYNEVPDSLARQYATFEATRLGLMHAAGLRSVVGNFSVGTPDIPVWSVYRVMLDAMGPGDFVGLHEYWADGEMLANDWYCGRWKHVPELAGKPLVITECGRDYVDARGGPWRRTCSPAQYIDELARYAEIARPHLATVFTAGMVRGWEEYDVSGIWQDVVARYSAPTASQPKRIVLYTPLTHWDKWRVTAKFGERGPMWADGVHHGVDMVHADGCTDGAAIFSPVGGEVDVNSWRRDRGWYVYLADRAQGIEVMMCHLREQSVLRPGDPVQVGDFVGHVGATGTQVPHLHIGVCRVDDNLNILEWIDPFANNVEWVAH